MVWAGDSWVSMGENEIADRPAIPDPMAGPPVLPGWYRIPGVEDKAHYWDGRTLAHHAEWIPRGVALPVATDAMRTARLPSTGVGSADTVGWRPRAARGAWWSFGIVCVLFPISLVTGGVASDPVMGGDWGGAVAPALGWVFGASCLGFVVPLVLGILAVRAGHQSAWAPLVLSIAALALLAPLFTIAALDVANRLPHPAMSQTVPINTVVESTEGGGFTVDVKAISCDAYECWVELIVTNNGPASAAFPCDELSASGPSGTVLAKGYDNADASVDSRTDYYGFNTGSCALDEIGPGQSRSMFVILFEVNGQELDTLTIPGAAQTVSLPPVEVPPFEPNEAN
jgi:hypothetical protein